MSRSGIFRIAAYAGGFLALWFVFSQFGNWQPLVFTLLFLAVAALIIRTVGLPRLITGLFAIINRFRPWHKLPPLLGTLNLDAKRIVLRAKNLYDTPPRDDLEAPQWSPDAVVSRTADGSFNDLAHPRMGQAGMRFGRNVPLQNAFPEPEPELLQPSPRLISQRLMTREEFAPATTLNLLAAAWIQFMVHGWVNHRRHKHDAADAEFFDVPLVDSDDWPQNPMRITRTLPSSTGTTDCPPTYENTESHWWDASQIYGSSVLIQHALRSFEGGRLKTEAAESDSGYRLPPNPEPAFSGMDHTGFFDNYWVGLSLFHTLFVREHNAICDALAAEYPAWDDEKLFSVARLTNAALLAKIHTVEWTPGILGHPTLQIAMDTNWWGFFGERFKKAFGRIGDSEELSGIIGSPADHHSASYSMTEEFTAIYRLHPLLPDSIRFFSVADGRELSQLGLEQVQGNNTRTAMAEMRMSDMLYSFGIQHPGALRLHNYPRLLQKLTRIDGEMIDLAAIDILRDRERGVPRYNEYRRLCHMNPVRKFSELTDNPEWAEQIEEVYQGDIDKVDLMVGMMAEPLPEGFGFSDTRFRIFILMASRRLKSDRFFTEDYRTEIYTRTGLEWIDHNNFASVLQRHHPEIMPALRDVKNSFAPWKPVGAW